MKGLVMRSTGAFYELQATEGKIYTGRLRGKFKQDGGLKSSNPIAVGDYVEFEIEDTAQKMVIINQIIPRENYLIRQSTHKKTDAHIIAANIDQALLIATLVMPRTSLGFIDRFLVSAEAFRIPAVVVFNKKDLLGQEGLDFQQELIEMYEKIGYAAYAISAFDVADIKKLNELLEGKKTLVSGHSGVGKSTIVNQIAPNLLLATNDISDSSLKGKHTTTFAEMFEIRPNTYLIDTPGIKELGLMNMESEEINHFFPEMRSLFGQCKYYNCTHQHEPNCAIIRAVESGEIAQSRYESYLSMVLGEDNRR
ncbi:MAG: ribosome small subunit-dependent GTPase A [Cytophagales bacterium]|nr:MAG: ribosome small subunit-dependent GTPase A [Cytophagales bacterium]